MTIKKLLGIGGTALALAFASPLGSGTAHAESPQASEVFACVGDPEGCWAAQDAANWALGTALWLYPAETLEDGAGDAFRHCSWSAALTQRVGGQRAEAITTRHEYASTPSSLSARVMDLGNKMIGREVGAQANDEGGSDTWGWIIQRCSALQDAGVLYGLGYDPHYRA